MYCVYVFGVVVQNRICTVSLLLDLGAHMNAEMVNTCETALLKVSRASSSARHKLFECIMAKCVLANLYESIDR